MIKKLYCGIRRVLGLESEPTIEVSPRPEDLYPTNGDQIRIVCTPIGYIRAGERLLTQMLEDKKKA